MIPLYIDKQTVDENKQNHYVEVKNFAALPAAISNSVVLERFIKSIEGGGC